MVCGERRAASRSSAALWASANAGRTVRMARAARGARRIRREMDAASGVRALPPRLRRPRR
eukprot:5737933-Prymnesium_polylepis.1